MAGNDSQYRFDSIDLAVYIWKKRIPLLIITFAAAVVSITGSLMITPRYKSSVVMFPTTPVSISKALLMPEYQWNLQAVGDEEAVEMVMQVLKSDKIRDKIIDRFNLLEHYGISPDDAHPLFKLHSFYKSNFNFKRTEFNSVVITVSDTDPQLAADMANDAVAMVDTTIWEMKNARAYKAYEYLKNEFDSVQYGMTEWKSCVHNLNKKGIINYDRQIERLTEAYGKALLDGNEEVIQEIEKEIYRIGDYSSDFIYCWTRYSGELLRMNNIRTQMLQLEAEFEQQIPTVFILDKAVKADKKAYPKKSIIVIVSTLSAFILAVLAFLFFENFMNRIKSV